MNFLRRLAQQLRDQWNGMSMAVRVGLVLAVVVAIGLIGLVAYTTYQPEWRSLYTNLSPEDLQNIRDKLDTQQTPYRIGSDGSSILVPSERVSTLRVDLAGQGLPAQQKGYELLDEPSLGSTPFRDSVNFLRAKQAELAKTIRGLDNVIGARVEIAKPEPSPFIREQKPTTASVMVHLKPGATLTPKQVKGIVAYVSRAVEGLAPDNVTVVDGKGQVLSEPVESDLGAASSHLEYRRAIESYLTSEVERVLSRTLGPGRAVVRVSADLNFKRLREMKETYNPDAKALKSEKTTSRKSQSGGGTGGRGIPGTTSNLAVRQAVGAAITGAAATTDEKEETSEVQYEVSRTRQELEEGLGSIERLSVAATVDLNPPEGTSSTAPLMPKADIERLIKQAVGFRQERGDEIQVSEARLATAAPPTPPEAPAGPTPEATQIEQIREWVNIGIKVCLGLGVLLLALAIGLAILRFTRPPRPVVVPAPTPAPEAVPPVRERVIDRLTTAAQRDPEALARALAALMERP